MGCDAIPTLENYITLVFLLTHPVWDVTLTVGINANDIIISTHTSRVGCDGEAKDFNDLVDISTHTSRVGCDSIPCKKLSWTI